MQSSSAEIVVKFEKNRNQIIAATIATIGSFGTGTVFGWSSATSTTIRSEFKNVTEEIISWTTSLAILGAFIGGPIAGFVMDYLGRKAAMLLFSIPFLLGWIIMCSAEFLKPDGIFLLYIGRIVTGFCAGAYLVIIPTYIREACTDNMRGVLGSLVPLLLVLGILYAFIVGAFCNWLVTSACCCVPPILLCTLGFFFVPETPRYLLSKQKTQQAVSALKWLCQIETEKSAHATLMHIYPAGTLNTKSTVITKGLRGLFMRPVGLPVVIMVIVMFFQQFGGVNAVTLYTDSIFKSSDDFIPYNIATIIAGIVQPVFVIAAMFLVDVVGRKVLLISGSFIMGLSLIGLGTYFNLLEKGDSMQKSLNWLPLVSVCVYLAAYSAGVGTIPWILATEIFNPNYRAESASIMNTAYWIFGFTVAKIYDNLNRALHTSGSFWLYGGLCMAGCIFTAVFVPETKGKSNEEMLNMFGVYTNDTISSTFDNVSVADNDNNSEDHIPDVNSDFIDDNQLSTEVVDKRTATEKTESSKITDKQTDKV